MSGIWKWLAGNAKSAMKSHSEVITTLDAGTNRNIASMKISFMTGCSDLPLQCARYFSLLSEFYISLLIFLGWTI